jgi:hypothetical protein
VKVKDTRHKTQGTRHKTQDTRHKAQDTRHKTQDTSHGERNCAFTTRDGERRCREVSGIRRTPEDKLFQDPEEK